MKPELAELILDAADGLGVGMEREADYVGPNMVSPTTGVRMRYADFGRFIRSLALAGIDLQEKLEFETADDPLPMTPTQFVYAVGTLRFQTTGETTVAY